DTPVSTPVTTNSNLPSRAASPMPGVVSTGPAGASGSAGAPAAGAGAPASGSVGGASPPGVGPGSAPAPALPGATGCVLSPSPASALTRTTRTTSARSAVRILCRVNQLLFFSDGGCG